MSPKRTSLSSLSRPKTGATPAAATETASPAAPAKPKKAKEAEQTFTVRLDVGTWKNLKLASMNLRKPASDIVREAIQAHLKGLGGTRA